MLPSGLYSKGVVSPRLSILRIRQRSLLRGVLLALAALVATLAFAGFPSAGAPRASHGQLLSVPLACGALVETARCLGRQWSLYYAGVLILLYSELMILVLALFFCAYL
jgi:hypothetical protein